MDNPHVDTCVHPGLWTPREGFRFAISPTGDIFSSKSGCNCGYLGKSEAGSSGSERLAIQSILFLVMSEQRDAEIGVFDRVFNAAAPARRELMARTERNYSGQQVDSSIVSDGQPATVMREEWDASHEQRLAQQFGPAIITAEASLTFIPPPVESRFKCRHFGDLQFCW